MAKNDQNTNVRIARKRFRTVRLKLFLFVILGVFLIAAVALATYRLTLDRKTDKTNSSGITIKPPTAKELAQDKYILNKYKEDVDKATSPQEKSSALSSKASVELSTGDNQAALDDYIAAYTLLQTYNNAYQIAHVAEQMGNKDVAKKYIAIAIEKLRSNPDNDPTGIKTTEYEMYQKEIGS